MRKGETYHFSRLKESPMVDRENAVEALIQNTKFRHSPRKQEEKWQRNKNYEEEHSGHGEQKINSQPNNIHFPEGWTISNRTERIIKHAI